MDIIAILALIEKGILVAEVLIKAGKNAAPAFNALKDMITGARNGAVSQVDMDKTSALLDAMIAEFNEEI